MFLHTKNLVASEQSVTRYVDDGVDKQEQPGIQGSEKNRVVEDLFRRAHELLQLLHADITESDAARSLL